MRIERKQQQKRPSFTLFELLMATLLLATIIASIGISFPTLLESERFERGVEKIVDEISFVTDFIVVTKKEARLHLKKQSGGILCTSSCHPPVFIKGIEELFFNNEKKESIELLFNGHDCVITKGRLTLSQKKRIVTIVLPGYPTTYLPHEKKIS